MLFEVFGQDKQGKMQTNYIDLVPWEDIPSMAKSGCTFKWEGKIISKSALLAKQPATTSKSSRSSYAADTASVSGVLCVETGIVYRKQSEAAKALKIDPAQVSDSIRTGRPRSGYTFKKV